MKTYCMYLRKSRADRDSELTSDVDVLKRHEEILLTLAKKMKLNIVKIFREVVSGDSISARPEMQQLLKEVEQGLYDGVLVIEVERLARGDTKDQGIVADTFKYSKTKIITPVKTYDPQDEFDEEYFEFGLFMSRREYKTINRRLQRGRMKSASEGKWIASEAPYGYSKVKLEHDKGYTLKINSKEAPVVRTIFEWYSSGEMQADGTLTNMGMTLIANRLDSLGIKPRRAKHWSRASIHDILVNPVYIGKIRWQYRKDKKQMIDGTLTKTRPKSKDYLLYDGIHEPIIDHITFQKVQDTMKHSVRTPIPSNKVLKNQLAGIVYCEKCGQLMTRLGASSRNKYDTLKCPNRYCDNVSSPIFLVEDSVISALSDWLKNYEVDCNPVYDTSALETKVKLIKNLENEKKILNGQLEKAYDLLEQEIYSTEIFLQRSKSLSKQITEIEKQLMTCQASYHSMLAAKEKQESIIPEIHHVIDCYADLNTSAAKNELLKTVIDHVTYLKTERNTRGKLLNANFEITIYPKLPETK